MKFLPFIQFINEAKIEAVINRLGQEDDYGCLDMDDYINHFISKGAKRLSGGASAEVLSFEGKVIKIYGAINDPAMTRYLSFCISNKSNIFVPKITKILKSWATEEDRWIFAIFMENLISSRPDFEKDLNGLLLNDTFSIGFQFGASKSEDNRFFSMLKEVVMKYSKPSTEKDLDSVLNFLQGAIRKYRYSIDFGPQNWMMRGNQLVLIDPFWPDME
jgi:hypothetical protein